MQKGMTVGELIPFPTKKKKKKVKRQKRVKNVDDIKYFNEKQIKLLRRTVRDEATLASLKGSTTATREWLAIDLLSSTGLRVSEAADLKIKDLEIGYLENKIHVRNGKCGISGHVVIHDSLKKHLKSFLKWKEKHGEGINPNDYLFIGQRGKWTSQAIQLIVKKYLKRLGIYESGKSAHSLRHSYAMELYRRSKDLLAVKKQLRHVSLQSTLVYTGVSDEDIAGQIKNLWGN